MDKGRRAYLRHNGTQLGIIGAKRGIFWSIAQKHNRPTPTIASYPAHYWIGKQK